MSQPPAGRKPLPMKFRDRLFLHDIVELCGFDLTKTRALRNQVQNTETGAMSWDLWRREPERFDIHQGLFRSRRLDDISHVVSFVETADNEALFVGMRRVVGYRPCPHDIRDPVNDEQKPHIYELQPVPGLSSYVERMVVDWGRGRNWVRHLPGKGRPIVIAEIRENEWHRPFPGYTTFQTTLHEIDSFSTVWASHLSNCCGVYLLVHPDTGNQYVGAATGSDGFLGRWRAYAANGHGGNKLLRPLARAGIPNYRISILEVAGSAATSEDVLRREASWKDKLGSRAYGLNAN